MCWGMRPSCIQVSNIFFERYGYHWCFEMLQNHASLVLSGTPSLTWAQPLPVINKVKHALLSQRLPTSEVGAIESCPSGPTPSKSFRRDWQRMLEINGGRCLNMKSAVKAIFSSSKGSNVSSTVHIWYFEEQPKQASRLVLAKQMTLHWGGWFDLHIRFH